MQVLVYGAGAYGTLTQKILANKNIVTDYFVDRKFAGEVINGILVLDPKDIGIYKNSRIYIASKNFYSEIKRYLLKQGCSDIKDIIEVLDSDIKGLELKGDEIDAWRQRKSYNVAVQMDKVEGAKFVHVESVVTEKCTLNCRDCSSLMPYYRNPIHVNIKDLNIWINNLLDKVAFIGELRILGGEPFLNPELDILISSLAKSKKIGMITVYTNGTIIPNENVIKVIKENEVFVHISNYGMGNRNRNKLIQIFDNMEIEYTVREYEEWYEFGAFYDNNLSEKELSEMYHNCISSNCPTILNGRLFHCPRAAHACSLGLIENMLEDSIDLNAKELDTFLLDEFLNSTRFINACRYCHGTSDSRRIVKAAIQKKNGQGE